MSLGDSHMDVSRPGIWQFRFDDGSWRRFSRRNQKKVEQAFRKYSAEKGVLAKGVSEHQTVTFNTAGWFSALVQGKHYATLDFGTMVQTNDKTGRSREVRRLVLDAKHPADHSDHSDEVRASCSLWPPVTPPPDSKRVLHVLLGGR